MGLKLDVTKFSDEKWGVLKVIKIRGSRSRGGGGRG